MRCLLESTLPAPGGMNAAMLRRLFLALLTLCLALPAALPTGAAAQPAHATAMAMAHHQHHQPADSAHHDASKHQCIGCAAPVSRAPEPPTPPQLRGPSTRPALSTRLPETRAGPDTPPPRS